MGWNEASRTNQYLLIQNIFIMKKYLLMCIVILCATKVLYSQTSNSAAIHLMDSLNSDTNQTPENYFKVMDSVATILYPNDSSEDGPKNNYNRFKRFYKSRMPSNSGNTNLFRAYAEALEASRTLSDNDCGDEESFRGDWVNIGPKDLDAYQNNGWVTDVWVDQFPEACKVK